jgi:phosphoglycolate phosphatase
LTVTASDPRFRAVLFDFDGTLIDSYPAIAASVNHVRSLYQLPPLPEAEVRRHVGRGPYHLIQQTVGQGDLEANVTAYRTHHPTVFRTGTRLLPGAREALATLAGRGYLLGICSNKPVAFSRELVAFLSVEPFLRLVLGPEDVARPKPAPDMLLAALPRLGVPAAQVLYIGDMVVDIQTARAAGVTVWVVATGSESEADLDAASPDRRLKGLEELPALLPGPARA